MVSLRRGTRLGKYRLDRRLGRGSFAEVWKARDRVEQRYVALKIALPEMIHEYERKELEREARIASQLSHPNVVAVRNADWNDGHFVIATDLAERNLAEYEILTGQLPSWPFEWPPPRHDRFLHRVPAPVQAVLRKAANFDPDRRYPDAVVLHEALENAFRRAESEQSRQTRRRKKAPSKPSRSPLQVEAELFRRHHGRGLKLRFRCHRCDGPISEAMPVCPWCGTGDNSFRDITRHPLYCPECERGLKPEWTACPWCYPGRLEGNGKPPRPDPDAERTCTARGCDGQLQPFMRYCPRCKQKPRRPWTHPDLPDRCPRCRWPVSRQSWRFCPWCGRREPHAGTFGSHRR